MNLNQLLGQTWDVIIIGAGHNGMIAAGYLRRRGLKVLVLEQRHIVGGVTVTEPFPDFPEAKQTSASYVLSLFPRKIINDHQLFEHGLELLERNPNAFTPLKDGRHFMRYNEMEKTQREIAKFSDDDAEAYPRFAGALHEIAKFSNKMMFMTPPDPFKKRDMFKAFKMLRMALKLGEEDFYKLIDLFSVSAHEFITRYVKSEPLVATLCSDGIIGTCGGPYTPGTAYVLLHHDIGDLSEQFGEWFYVKGGMGGLADSILSSCLSVGVEFLLNTDVTRILTRKKRVNGVQAMYEGREVNFKTKAVMSGADAYQTYVNMCDPDDLPPGFLDSIKMGNYDSPTYKVNMLIEESDTKKLEWFCDYNGPTPPGTIHLGCETSDHIERAYDDSKYGGLSKDMILEMCVLPKETEMAPEGYRSVSILGQYVPYDHPSGQWDEAAEKDLLERTLDKMSEYCNIRDVLVTSAILTPVSMEKKFRLTGGNIFQGAMPLRQLLSMRPIPGYAQYRGPFRGLWMCGATTHPGGGAHGINGHNAAREFKKRW